MCVGFVITTVADGTSCSWRFVAGHRALPPRIMPEQRIAFLLLVLLLTSLFSSSRLTHELPPLVRVRAIASTAGLQPPAAPHPHRLANESPAADPSCPGSVPAFERLLQPTPR